MTATDFKSRATDRLSISQQNVATFQNVVKPLAQLLSDYGARQDSNPATSCPEATAVRFTGMPGAIQISSSRDLAYADATYKMTYTNPQTSKVESGNGYCLWVFRRQQDRSWKIVRDVSSAVPTVG